MNLTSLRAIALISVICLTLYVLLVQYGFLYDGRHMITIIEISKWLGNISLYLIPMIAVEDIIHNENNKTRRPWIFTLGLLALTIITQIPYSMLFGYITLFSNFNMFMLLFISYISIQLYNRLNIQKTYMRAIIVILGLLILYVIGELIGIYNYQIYSPVFIVLLYLARKHNKKLALPIILIGIISRNYQQLYSRTISELGEVTTRVNLEGAIGVAILLISTIGVFLYLNKEATYSEKQTYVYYAMIPMIYLIIGLLI